MNKTDIINKIVDYQNKAPEIQFTWQDSYSNSKGLLIINSLKNAAAAGGTRVETRLSAANLLGLAKIMELKFNLYGPLIGGAKSSVEIDDGLDKRSVLQRWFNAILPILRDCYGTAGDLNTSYELIQSILSESNIPHPQYGVLSNKYHNYREILAGMQMLNQKIAVIANHKFELANVVTGFSLAESIKSYYLSTGSDIKGKKVFIQGVGSVGGACALKLATMGAKICGLIDIDSGLFEKSGLSLEVILDIFTNASLRTQKNSSNHTSFYQSINNESIDIFIPAAGSRLVDKKLVDLLTRNGLSVFASGSNIPFSEEDYLYGELAQYVDERLAFIPSFVANSGLASAFSSIIKDSNHDNADTLLETVLQHQKTMIQTAVNHNGDKQLAAYFLRQALAK